MAPSERAQALRARLAAWQPFPEAEYVIDLLGSQAQVFAFSRTALDDLPKARLLWPESLLHVPGDDGLRLVVCLEGFEGQCWREGILRSSRWWQVPPDAAEWRDFARQAQITAEVAPQALELPWMRPARPISSLAGLGQSLRGQERLLAGLVTLALLGSFATVAHGAWDAWQARSVAESQLQAMKEDVAPMVRARDSALADAGRAAILVRQLQAASPLQVLDQLEQLLPRAVRVREFELQNGSIKLNLELPAEVTRAKLVGDLESGGWFRQVTEAKDGASQGGISLEMKLSGPQPPNHQNPDAGLKRAAIDTPSGPPALDVTPVPAGPGSAPRGGRP